MAPDSRGQTRRTFLARTGLVAGSALLAGCKVDTPFEPDPPASPDRDRSALYLDESGSPERDGPAVLGALLVDRPEAQLLSLHDLRRRHRYYTRLDYSRANRHQVAYAASVLERFASDDGLSFTARIFPGRAGRAGSSRSGGAGLPADAYLRLARELSSSGGVGEIRVERRSVAGGDGALDAYLRERFSSPRVRAVEASGDDLAQLAGYLTGLVFGDVSGTRSGVKVRMIRGLRDLLGVSRLGRTMHHEAAGFTVA